jgi:hypothetical protein
LYCPIEFVSNAWLNVARTGARTLSALATATWKMFRRIVYIITIEENNKYSSASQPAL